MQISSRWGLEWIRSQVQGRRATLTSVGAMMSSQFLAAVLGVAGGLVQARFISPEVLGYYSWFGILAGYLTFLHMGSLTTLQRDYPYWLGKGDTQRAEHSAAVSQGWILIICAVMATLYGGLVLGSLAAGNYKAAGAWGTQLVIGSLYFYTLYLGCTYRSTHEFVTWSKISATTSVASFLMLPLVAIWGFWGLCLRGALPTLWNGWILHRKRPVHVAPRLAFGELWAQVRFGLPMDIAGFLATSCMTSTMSSMVAARYGVGMLGLFAFARVAESMTSQLGVAITGVFIPRINHQMGLTDDLRHCARYTLKPMLACLAVVVSAILVGSILCGPMVRLLTPKYVEAIPLLQVLLWAGLYPVLLLPTHVLAAGRHNYAVAFGFATAFASFLLMAGAAILLKMPPIWIAVAYVAAKAINALVCYVLLWLRLRQPGRFIEPAALETHGPTCV